MAVEKGSSIKPTAPRKPPAVEPTKGVSGQPGVGYGDLRNLKVSNPAKSEFSHHFTSNDGSAKSPGAEKSNEGTDTKAGKPGYK